MQLVIIPWISLAVHFSSSLFNIRIFCNVISTCKIHQKVYKTMLGTYLRLCVGLQAGGKQTSFISASNGTYIPDLAE